MGTRGAHSRTSARGILAVAAALVAGLLSIANAQADSGVDSGTEWTVVVNPANPTRTVTREHLDRIYRRRVRFWPDGTPVLPVNLPSGDALRHRFSVEVLHDDEDELATFWNRQYFQGIAPPAVLQSSKAVRAYVAATPNAIGYIDAADVDASVAIVGVRDED